MHQGKLHFDPPGVSGSFNAMQQLPAGWGPAMAYNDDDDSFANRLTQGHMGIPGFDPLKPKGPGSGFGWNMDTMNMLGKGLGGLGNLASGWAAIKGLGIAEDELEENKRQYNQNYAQQLRAFEGDRTRANTRISDQNAWKTAQGRTDLGSLIL